MGVAHQEDDFLRILQHFIRLEVKKGHLKWKITDLAKQAGVARTSIYYHFGKSRTDMVKTAVDVLMTKVMGLDPNDVKLWASGRYAEAVLFSKEMVQQCPEMAQFYFYWKNNPGTEIEQRIRSYEASYIRKLQKTFPQLTDEMAEVIYSFLQSLVLHNHIQEKHVQLAVPLLLKMLKTPA